MTLIITLVVIGLIAILAELVLPGGLLGVVGALCLLGAVITTFVEYGATAGVIGLFLLIALGIATIGWWMKYFHKLPGTKQLILHNESGKADRAAEELVGQPGVALTDLVPSGHARIDGRKYDVIAESGSVRKDAEIVVIAKRGPSLIVRLAENS
ncbi:MAG: NfeD family protein [Verrucomicrobiales bacterium]|jgi:membrane-bound serine protease (ClpP class)|nr:NfeD family protein [Verrucomicrobiales bacterium]